MAMFAKDWSRELDWPVDNRIANDLEYLAEMSLASSVLREALTGREYDILVCRYVKGMTQEEVGKLYGVCKATISHTELRALRKLRHPKWSKRLRGLV